MTLYNFPLMIKLTSKQYFCFACYVNIISFITLKSDALLPNQRGLVECRDILIY